MQASNNQSEAQRYTAAYPRASVFSLYTMLSYCLADVDGSTASCSIVKFFGDFICARMAIYQSSPTLTYVRI